MTSDHQTALEQLERFGLLEPDQPTETATREYQETRKAEFTPEERWQLRLLLLKEQQ